MPGLEWLVEAFDCDPVSLRDTSRLQALLRRLIDELPLNPVGEPVWHQFGGGGGITGLCLLAESHFACHTFPEHGSITINLFCCKPRPEWDFRSYLTREFGAKAVRVRRLERPYGVAVPRGVPLDTAP
ncbi:MAG: S-adenosylmethionine decarboxylase [Acidobacteriia bacterium]|nr:S-adenosylmethionine decarboxylase [Terriglobia bacterium]